MQKPEQTTFLEDSIVYVMRIRQFDLKDWLVYTVWVGMMLGLFSVIAAFFSVGYINGIEYPGYAWNIPVGTFIFTAAIAFDTIGHRTVYKEALQRGEALVHHITIAAGISSVLALCLAYENPSFMKIPALVLIFLSIVYSLVDEGMHWHRYFTQKSDRVEMWSHFFILVGHLIMITAWWTWFVEGYPGVKETLAVLK
ncbi:hypothetical protein AZI87_05765 [Bdellovibrio bacteriovorus]|uniref:Uncharacterized protein n=1 Tax=Bdellovibrio bacteriovorus TaxID=959 RepID=A0A162GQY0_BDEBC|nr:hypothetical protein [Bdellovibrio bacteriovorus]KYG68737.1 hypothetical protein AZI87_05765 [Bdellovibrio bacteriovorus]